MSLKPFQLSAILGSGILSGGSLYISAFAIPAILSPYSNKVTKRRDAVPSAKALQKQWKHVYDTGKLFFPSLSLLTSSTYLYLAYNSPAITRPLLLLSACSTIAILPYTLLCMMGNIKKIEAPIKEEEDALDVPRLKGDIEKWSLLHAGRVVLLFAGFSVGTWAVLQNGDV